MKAKSKRRGVTKKRKERTKRNTRYRTRRGYNRMREKKQKKQKTKKVSVYLKGGSGNRKGGRRCTDSLCCAGRNRGDRRRISSVSTPSTLSPSSPSSSPSPSSSAVHTVTPVLSASGYDEEKKEIDDITKRVTRVVDEALRSTRAMGFEDEMEIYNYLGDDAFLHQREVNRMAKKKQLLISALVRHTLGRIASLPEPEPEPGPQPLHLVGFHF